MNYQELRKVTFSLNFPDGFTPDEKEQRDMDEMSVIRYGLFHGSEEVYENGLKSLKFVVEDEKTGKVYKVNPELVVFLK